MKYFCQFPRGFLCLAGCLFALAGFNHWAVADIRDTKHNLSGKSAGSAEKGRTDRDVCVFCHTPSVEDSAAADGAAVPSWPKWQRSIETAFSFELFDDVGRGEGNTALTGVSGSVSIACLSCHDGVQAFGVSPGAGSDHPFGVPYRGLVRGGESASKYRDRILASQDAPVQTGMRIGDDSEFRPARSSTVNKRQVWWAATTTNVAQRSKNDLPLAPRRMVDGVGGYEQIPFVECTSCHDPHTTREVFLRTSNDGSKLCMTCHVK